MNNFFGKLNAAAMMLAAGMASSAWAVNDLPGGPAVRQLNLAPAATKIAEEQAWLHRLMLIICLSLIHI